MKRNIKYQFLSILMLVTLLLTACGGSAEETERIATAVAMTVVAKDTEAAKIEATVNAQVEETRNATEADPTSTLEAGAATATPTEETTFSPPTAPGPVGSGKPCLLANLISETIPDGQIMQPGQSFWKTWRLKNNGSCTWNLAYRLVYWDDNLMDGKLEYPLGEIVNPGEEADITILLNAPTTNGNHKSSWKLLSDTGVYFGVGQYDQAFYAQINVNDSTSPDYTVTNVSYNITRDPAAGCATNVWYRVHATITTNGPTAVKYQWKQSDGNNTSSNPGVNKTIKFTQAESITLTREWSFHLGATPGTKWMQMIIHAPDYQEYPQATFVYDCQ